MTSSRFTKSDLDDILENTRLIKAIVAKKRKSARPFFMRAVAAELVLLLAISALSVHYNSNKIPAKFTDQAEKAVFSVFLNILTIIVSEACTHLFIVLPLMAFSMDDNNDEWRDTLNLHREVYWNKSYLEMLTGKQITEYQDFIKRYGFTVYESDTPEKIIEEIKSNISHDLKIFNIAEKFNLNYDQAKLYSSSKLPASLIRLREQCKNKNARTLAIHTSIFNVVTTPKINQAEAQDMAKKVFNYYDKKMQIREIEIENDVIIQTKKSV